MAEPEQFSQGLGTIVRGPGFVMRGSTSVEGPRMPAPPRFLVEDPYDCPPRQHETCRGRGSGRSPGDFALFRRQAPE